MTAQSRVFAFPHGGPMPFDRFRVWHRRGLLHVARVLDIDRDEHGIARWLVTAQEGGRWTIRQQSSQLVDGIRYVGTPSEDRP